MRTADLKIFIHIPFSLEHQDLLGLSFEHI